MILRVAGRTRCGAVVDLRDLSPAGEGGRERTDGAAVDGMALAAAVRGDQSPYGVVCPPPGPVHERAGHVHAEMSLSPRTALAAAGRSLGIATPHDAELDEVRAELAAVESAQRSGPVASSAAVPASESGDAAPPQDADVDRLKERVAELRGRIQTLEDADRDAADERTRLRETAARLSELTTERVAAVERRDRARARRDRRERRMRLQDREANLERSARAHLVDRLRERYVRSVTDLDPDVEDPFDADPVTAALAVLRVAAVRAPVVLAADRFADPAAAAGWLDAPVVRL